MNNHYQINVEQGYIHVVNNPGFDITQQTVLDQWRELAAICKETGLRKILIEAQKPHRNMDTSDALKTGTFFEEQGLHALNIALCFTDYETDKLSDFFMNVGYNRGIQIQFFTNSSKALEWLEIKTPPA